MLSQHAIDIADSSWDVQDTIGRDAFEIRTVQKASVAWKCVNSDHGSEWYPIKYSQLRQLCDPHNASRTTLNTQHEVA